MGRADEIRASVPAGASVADDVARIIAGVRSGGDAALEEFEVGFGAGARAPFTAEAGVLDDAVREEIAVATARLIANPVAHKLKAAAIDEVLERLRER